MKAAIFVLALLGGCFAYPKEVTSERMIGTTREEPVAGPLGPLALQADVEAVEIHKHLEMAVDGLNAGNNLDPRALLVVGALAAMTGAVSGFVSMVIIVADRGGSTTREQHRQKRAFDCPVAAADVSIDVTFPTGDLVHGTTDSSGTFVTPNRTAAAPGVVVMQSGRRVQRELAGFSAVRDALRACADRHHVTGVIRTVLEIDRDGRVNAVPDLGGDRFGACVHDSLVATRFPHGHEGMLVFPYKL